MKHRVIIAEDDPEVAQVLVEIVQMLGHEAVVAATLEELRAAVLSVDACYFLQDLQMPAVAGARPTAASGEAAIEFIRKHHPEVDAAGRHLRKIYVVTSHRDEAGYGMRLARLGADDFIKKPFGEPENVHAKILAGLEEIGRKDHEACIAAARGVDVASGRPLLAIAGERDGKRTIVTLGGKRVSLREQLFELLVRLVDAELRGVTWVSRVELRIANANNDVAFRASDEFWKAGAVPRDFQVIVSSGEGTCRLHPAVEIGIVDWVALSTHTSDVVQKIATTRLPKRRR